MTATTETGSAARTPRTDLNFVWLEITGKCQLECIHCYAESGPSGSHGVMERADWLGVIDQCAGLGVQMVQFIGGEPTLPPPHRPARTTKGRPCTSAPPTPHTASEP